MKLRGFTLSWCVAGLLLVLAAVSFADDFKNFKPTGYVTDRAGIISAQTKTQLEALCLELQQKTGSQMAIVTVKSLDGNDIESYAVDLYKQLGIGSKKEDNGVLLLVAPNDRRYRVEVGYGIEPIINDARAGDAGRTMAPYLRQGDYSSGIAAAAWQLAKYIADDKGVTLTGAPELRPIRQHEDHSNIGIWIFLGIILLIFLMSRSGGSGSNISRGGGGGSGWWIGPVIGGGWGGSRGGGSWGGGGGGSWGGGGGGFGGFGGGSSGGGGASGSW
ncbi:MAG TPA: TPM domain-containing protein [Candidatus Acidoferrum sp.]|nr:TPM domain-containing protein [Candidatus Acidoferrum sp.]